MGELQFLTWVRGTGLNLAISIFLLGVLVRLLEIYSLGRKKDLAEPRNVGGRFRDEYGFPPFDPR